MQVLSTGCESPLRIDVIFFFIKEIKEAIRKFRFRNVTWKYGTFSVSKQHLSQSIQLLAWIALWQLLTVMLMFGRKNRSFFSSFSVLQKVCPWTVRPLERHCLSALRRLHMAPFTSSVIHRADGHAVTVQVTSGTCQLKCSSVMCWTPLTAYYQDTRSARKPPERHQSGTC